MYVCMYVCMYVYIYIYIHNVSRYSGILAPASAPRRPAAWLRAKPLE